MTWLRGYRASPGHHWLRTRAMCTCRLQLLTVPSETLPVPQPCHILAARRSSNSRRNMPRTSALLRQRMMQCAASLPYQAALGLGRLPQRQPLRAHAEGVVCFLLPGTRRQRFRQRLLRAGAGAGAVVQKTGGGVVRRPLLGAGLRGAGGGRGRRCGVGAAVRLRGGCFIVGPQRAGCRRCALACTDGSAPLLGVCNRQGLHRSSPTSWRCSNRRHH